MKMIKDGYKKTEVGIIPDNWLVKSLKDSCLTITDGSHSSPAPINSSKYYIATVVHMKKEGFDLESLTPIDKADFDKLEKNGCRPLYDDVLLSKDGTIGKIMLFRQQNNNIVLLSSIAIIRPNTEVLFPSFLSQYLMAESTINKLINMKKGSAIRRIILKDIKSLIICIPTEYEQQRIAEILSATDEHIERLDKTIEDYQLLKKGIMKKLLTEGIGHNEYKDTEIGKIPKSWIVLTVEEAFIKQTKSQYKQLKTNEYLALGSYPIVDQGQQNICGYTNDEEKLYKGELPVIVFGDHTRIVKYVDFRFAVGADGTQILKADNSKFNDRFFYYILQNTPIVNQGYHRHFKSLKESKIAQPPLVEQAEIALILSEFDKHINIYLEQRENFIQLKKALMEQLLTGKIRVMQ